MKTNLRSRWFISFPDWLYYVMKSTETLNSKIGQNYRRYTNRNTKKRKHEKLKNRRRKPSFTKRVGWKCTFINPYWINNDHTGMILKIQFRSSFKFGTCIPQLVKLSYYFLHNSLITFCLTFLSKQMEIALAFIMKTALIM